MSSVHYNFHHHPPLKRYNNDNNNNNNNNLHLIKVYHHNRHLHWSLVPLKRDTFYPDQAVNSVRKT